MDNGDYEAIMNFIGKKKKETEEEKEGNAKNQGGWEGTPLSRMNEKDMRHIMAPLFDKFDKEVGDFRNL